MTVSWLTGHVATATAIAGLLVMGTSGFVMFAAGNFSADIVNDPRALVARGSAAAELMRWACVADLIGYLLMAPVAIYFYVRLGGDRFVAFYTFAGLAYVLIGATGAVILGAAAPPLMRAYPPALAAQQEAIRTNFSTLHLIVLRGLWQTLELVPAAVWLLGVGHSLYRSSSRTLGLVLLAIGALAALGAAGRLLSP
jgi:hypothetical protein